MTHDPANFIVSSGSTRCGSPPKPYQIKRGVARNQQISAVKPTKGENVAAIGYIDGMSRVVALSLTLVAVSAGAGLGLSSLHKFSMSNETAMLQAPIVETPGASGFVLPEYVPTLETVAKQTPTQPVVAPIIEPEESVSSPTLAVREVQPEPAPTNTAVAPATRSVRVIEAPEPTYDRKRVKARAEVASNDFVMRLTSQSRPDYVVGVYR